ncbi:hypothetical protein NPIL_403291 [Nephila pilipes]|uniref:Uncharacterized protein n=1 Tax=Nephila pilipes TaxID=299642 RepID=A0A8X6N2G4_NEPPI|nr:hypothetical protein NPIL_403291 [Nephila pilipes]
MSPNPSKSPYPQHGCNLLSWFDAHDYGNVSRDAEEPVWSSLDSRSSLARNQGTMTAQRYLEDTDLIMVQPQHDGPSRGTRSEDNSIIRISSHYPRPHGYCSPLIC